MARFIGDDGPDVPADNLDPETLQPSTAKPPEPTGPRPHPAARGVHGLDWLTMPDAARWIGVHPNTLRRWCEEDEARIDGPAQAPPFQRIGRRRDRRFRVTDLEQFIKARVVESPRVATVPVQP